MKTISFTIDAVPVPKGRPRFSRSGHAYTPEKTRAYERLIGLTAKMAIIGETGIDLNAPVSVDMVFYMPIPKSWSKKKIADAIAGRIKHTKRPDCDNLFKILCDGCNGILWKDDAQIFSGKSEKLYSDHPRTEATVTYFESE